MGKRRFQVSTGMYFSKDGSFHFHFAICKCQAKARPTKTINYNTRTLKFTASLFDSDYSSPFFQERFVRSAFHFVLERQF